MVVDIGVVTCKVDGSKGAIQRQAVIKETAKEQVKLTAIGLKG